MPTRFGTDYSPQTSDLPFPQMTPDQDHTQEPDTAGTAAPLAEGTYKGRPDWNSVAALVMQSTQDERSSELTVRRSQTP
jgi:hypothetical protein